MLSKLILEERSHGRREGASSRLVGSLPSEAKSVAGPSVVRCVGSEGHSPSCRYAGDAEWSGPWFPPRFRGFDSLHPLYWTSPSGKADDCNPSRGRFDSDLVLVCSCSLTDRHRLSKPKPCGFDSHQERCFVSVVQRIGHVATNHGMRVRLLLDTLGSVDLFSSPNG